MPRVSLLLSKGDRLIIGGLFRVCYMANISRTDGGTYYDEGFTRKRYGRS